MPGQILQELINLLYSEPLNHKEHLQSQIQNPAIKQLQEDVGNAGTTVWKCEE